MNIPEEIIIYSARYFHFATIISLLKTCKQFNSSKKIYYILVSRIDPNVNKVNFFTSNIESMMLDIIVSYTSGLTLYSDVCVNRESRKYIKNYCTIPIFGITIGDQRVCHIDFEIQRRDYSEYDLYTIEGLKNMNYFPQHEIPFLNPNVASEYLDSFG